MCKRRADVPHRTPKLVCAQVYGKRADRKATTQNSELKISPQSRGKGIGFQQNTPPTMGEGAGGAEADGLKQPQGSALGAASL